MIAACGSCGFCNHPPDLEPLQGQSKLQKSHGTMVLCSFQRLLAKLCDPNHSVALSESPTPNSKVAAAAVEKAPTGARAAKKRPQLLDGRPSQMKRHDTPSNHSHNARSPINQLPNELVAEIFATVCHADSDQFLGHRQRHRKTTPLVLGAVCAHWRQVVQRSPRIWSHISLCLSNPWARYEAQVSLLREWLSRSGVCPLTINLVFQNEDEWSNMVANELVDLLAEHAFRWQSINFVLPEAWYPLFDCIKFSLRQLTNVSTQPLWTDCGLSPSKRKKLILFEHAPRLNDLHLNGYYLTDVFLPWSQLTRLTLQHVYLDECFYTLPRTPNLTWCRIYTILINDVNRTTVDPETPIVLDKLNKLIVYSAPWGDLMRLLSFLSAPRLQSFEISALLDDLVFPQLSTELRRVATHSRCGSSLTRLTLSDLDFMSRPAYETEFELKAFLKEMPMLEELEIEVSKKADGEKAAFCVSWFIDLLGMQEERHEEEGKEKGFIGVGSEGPVGRDGQAKGKASAVVKDATPPELSPTTVRPPSKSHSPYFILPNLQHFTFTGNIIVLRHSFAPGSTNTSDNDSDKDEDLAVRHSTHLRCGQRGTDETEFPRLLLEALCWRGGFGWDSWDPPHGKDIQEEKNGLPNAVEGGVVPPPPEDAQNAESNLFIFDDQNDVRALPADIFLSSSSCAIGSRRSRTTPPAPPFNLRKRLTSFVLKANLYGSVVQPSRSTICVKSHHATDDSVIVAADGGNGCDCSANNNNNDDDDDDSKRLTDFAVADEEGGNGAAPSREICEGFKRLMEEGGMKIQVVLGGDAWV